MVEDDPSERLIDQRLRNRIMEALHGLAEGDEGVRSYGMTDYFEDFYDYIPRRGDGEMAPNGTITADERAMLLRVSAILDDARDAIPRDCTVDAFIASRWPERIRAVALPALKAMKARGHFREDVEEEEPSLRY